MARMAIRAVVASCLAALLALPCFVSNALASPERQQPVPQPFPRPGDTSGRPSLPTENPTTVSETQPSTSAVAPSETTPTEATLGLPIYPTAQFITSYDAGRGQRYYLFGTNSGFEEMVGYYRIILDERGDRVFDAPATHIFEVGRFREREMAFPPSVTIKDYTWDGSEGYLNPTGDSPPRFKTIIQVVPAPQRERQR